MDEQRIQEIRQRMQQMRGSLCRDMTDVVRSAHTLTDWRRYVASSPWVFLAAAAAMGYWIAPRTSKSSSSLSDDREQHNIPAPPNDELRDTPRAGMFGKAVRTLSSAAMRGVLAYVGQSVVQRFSNQTNPMSNTNGEASHAESSRG
jgi:hypothetical protein